MPGKIKHIYFADDDPDDYFLFKTTLQEVDNSVTISYFRHCDELLKNLKSSHDLPDIIVLDLNMPGNDGQKCLKFLKTESRLLHIPVIMYSTSNHDLAIKTAYQNGAYSYIVKPNSIEKLKVIIKDILTIEFDSPRSVK